MDEVGMKLIAAVERLAEMLLLIAIMAHEWNLHDAETLAFALALERRTD
jgi:hypothetical protein